MSIITLILVSTTVRASVIEPQSSHSDQSDLRTEEFCGNVEAFPS